MHREVGLQRITGAPARVGTPPAAFVERAKQKLRELARCEWDDALPPDGFAAGRKPKHRVDPRVRSRVEIWRLKGEAWHAVHCRPRRRLSFKWSYRIGLTQSNPRIPLTSACVEEQVVSGPHFMVVAVRGAHTNSSAQGPQESLSRRGQASQLLSRPPGAQSPSRAGGEANHGRGSSFWPRSPELRGAVRASRRARARGAKVEVAPRVGIPRGHRVADARGHTTRVGVPSCSRLRVRSP